MAIVPTVIEKNFDGEKHYDIFSMLLSERIIVLTGEINDQIASLIIAQLLYLSSKDKDKDIHLYINSPGGSINAGLAIYDTMNYISPDVSTICVGMCASMAAFLLSGGAKGKRYSLPNSEIMIHQPLGGAQGQATDIDIAAKRILILKEKMSAMLALNCGKDIEQVRKDTERDYFMGAKQALEYGLIDKIITSTSTLTK